LGKKKKKKKRSLVVTQHVEIEKRRNEASITELM